MTAAELAADELLPFADFPTETIWVNARQYNCLVGNFERGNDVRDGGLWEQYDLWVQIERASTAGRLPSNGDRVHVVFRHEYFRGRVKQDDAQSHITVFFTGEGVRQPRNPLIAEGTGEWILSEEGIPIDLDAGPVIPVPPAVLEQEVTEEPIETEEGEPIEPT